MNVTATVVPSISDEASSKSWVTAGIGALDRSPETNVVRARASLLAIGQERFET